MQIKIEKNPGTHDKALTEEIIKFVLDLGADMVGVAPVERLVNAPEGNRPTDYMPKSRSVISIGMHLVDGVCDVWGEWFEKGKTITPYLFYGYGLTNIELGRIANRASKVLEHNGYQGLMFPPTWAISTYRWMGNREHDDDDERADFSHRHAAVAAGLAEIGWSGLALTPKYGARVRFNSVITDAPLAPNTMYDGPPICQPDRCKYLCAKVCPNNALPKDKFKEVNIGDKHYKYSYVDMTRCFYGTLAVSKGTGAFSELVLPPGHISKDKFREDAKHRDSRTQSMFDNCFGIICGDFCGRCLHECPAHLYSRQQSKK